MAQSVIGALRVVLGMDSAQFSKGSKKANKELQTMKKQFAVVAGAAAALGAAITGMALKGAADIDRLAKAGRRIDGTAATMRSLELAASEAGVPISVLTNEIQNLGRELASGRTSAIEGIEQLGLNVEELQAMSADDRIATIADRVKELGLSADESSALLRDLGIRNREMVLLLMQGGDAIRAARADIEDYGLAISQVDAEAIEAARDQIGRLSLISSALGDALAMRLVPRMGELANAMTDSLREGGLLRRMIEGLVGNLDRLAAIVAVTVTAFGVRYVAAFAAARIATMTLAGALSMLRTAIARTGVGLIIVAIAEAVVQFGRLSSAAGGAGEAFRLLGDVAREAFERMRLPLDLFTARFRVMTNDLGMRFNEFTLEMLQGWLQVVEGMSFIFGGLSRSVQMAAKQMRESIGDAMNRSEEDAEKLNSELNETVATLEAIRGTPFASIQALRKVMRGTSGDTAEITLRVEELGGAFGDANDSAQEFGDTAVDTGFRFFDVHESMNQALDGYSENVDRTTAKLRAMQRVGFGLESSMSQSFSNVVRGVESLNDALSNTLNRMIDIMAQEAFRMFFRSTIGGFFGMPAFANGTVNAPGGLAMVGERGPEMVNLPSGSRVFDAQKTERMMGNGSEEVTINQTINLSTGVQQTVRAEVLSLMPQIAEVTKQSVADARRRGGTFASAFGG